MMKQYEHTAAVTINPSRVEKTRTRLIGRLVLALTLLSFSALPTYVAAQVRPPTAPPPTEKDPVKPPPRPDLVPLLSTIRPCEKDLFFHVVNSGNAAAPASTATAAFPINGTNQFHTEVKQVPSLLAGEKTTQLSTPNLVPSACFDSANTCKFSLTVDAGSKVNESNENNNTVSGVCQRKAP